MKTMKNLLTLFCVFLALIRANAQLTENLTLELCYSRATENYPLIRQRELIQKTREYSVSNAARGILPAIVLNAQQSYQSDVTQIPSDTGMPVLSKNQYKVYADINTPLYDGGAIRQLKRKHEADARIEEQKLEVELYQLKDRINQLFFGILLLDSRLEQNRLLAQDIALGLQKTDARIKNGTSLKSSADVLQADLLKTRQSAIELASIRSTYLDMLGMLTALPLSATTTLERPTPLPVVSGINRPELNLFQYQSDAIDIQSKMINSRNLPRLSSFLQAGYGRPGLNMLDNHADSYYIAGMRLNWNLAGLYTIKKEKHILELSRRNLQVQRETFLFNTNYTLTQQGGEIEKLRQLLNTDDEIVTLRSKVKQTASAQLENGIIDTNDYLREISAEDQARQLRIMHEVQLLMAQYALQTTAGI